MAELYSDEENTSVLSEVDALNLSYSSSPFEESDADVLEDDGAVHPYQFEPYLEQESPEENDTLPSQHDHDDRLGSVDWCSCDRCTAMPTAIECLCCREVQQVQDVMGEECQCITDHPGFEPVCLNLYVLQTAYFGYRQQYREEMEETTERHRYIAYRQFVRWCWGYLGRHNRVPIPACVVKKIRETFPTETTEYTGFKMA